MSLAVYVLKIGTGDRGTETGGNAAESISRAFGALTSALAPRPVRAYVCGVTRAAVVAVAGLCGAAGVGTWVAVRPHESATTAHALPRAHQLPAARRAADPFARWTITEKFSAQSVLVLQVETRHLGDAVAIAREISAPLEERHAEILIYFHRPGRPDLLPPRRVQWSRAGGFVETIYEQ